jgi:hypothetical protein
MDAGLRWRLDSIVSVDIKPEQNVLRTHSTLIVYLPGMIASVSQHEALLPTLREHGDVLCISYEGGRFSAPEVVNKLIGDIYGYIVIKQSYDPYRKIIFVGSSMGGLLAYDTIRQLSQSPIWVSIPPIELVLLDSPSTGHSLKHSLAASVLGVLPFGPIFNRLLRFETLRKYSISFWRDQLAYMLRHDDIEGGSLNDLVKLLTYIQCVCDNRVVRPSAFYKWMMTTKSVRLLPVKAGHVRFGECLPDWQTVIEKALRS